MIEEYIRSFKPIQRELLFEQDCFFHFQELNPATPFQTLELNSMPIILLNSICFAYFNIGNYHILFGFSHSSSLQISFRFPSTQTRNNPGKIVSIFGANSKLEYSNRFFRRQLDQINQQHPHRYELIIFEEPFLCFFILCSNVRFSNSHPYALDQR